jgi:hypothetical protein
MAKGDGSVKSIDVVLAAVFTVAGLAFVGGCGDSTPAGRKPGKKTGAQTGRASGGSGQAVQPQLSVAFSSGGVVLGKTAISIPCDLDELTPALGKPSRTLHLTNTIFVWDDLGIYAIAQPRTTKVRSVSVTFARTKYSYWPKVLHRNPVKMGRHVIKPDTAVSELSQMGFVQFKELPTLWVKMAGKCLLSLETDATGQRIVSLGMGTP